MQVRTNVTTEARLFDWDPENNVISIVKKDMIYRIKLFSEYNGEHHYKVIDRRLKNNKTQ